MGHARVRENLPDRRVIFRAVSGAYRHYTFIYYNAAISRMPRMRRVKIAAWKKKTDYTCMYKEVYDVSASCVIKADY